MTDGNAGGAANGNASGTTPPAAGTPPNTSPQEWTTGLSDELKGYVQTKGFKDPGAVLESYRNFEKLQGVPQDRLLKLPETVDLSTAEGRAIFERLGAPKEAKEYDVKVPAEVGDEKFVEWFKETAHKNGLTRKQAEGFINSLSETTLNQLKVQTEASQAKLQQEEAGLKNEWGAAFEQNTNIAKAGARALSLSKEHLDALEGVLGYSNTIKMLHKLGSATGEHEFIAGKPAGGGVLTPAQAAARLAELGRDKGFYARIKAGDADAKKQWHDLNMMAAANRT